LAGLILGHLSLGRDLVFAGRFAPSRSHLEEGLALYDPISHLSLVRQAAVHPQVVLREQLAFVLFCLGYPRQASAQSDAALTEARSLAHPPSLALSFEFGTRLLSLAGEAAALKERTEQLLANAIGQGFPHWRVVGTIYLGWVKVRDGDVNGGIALLRNAVSAYRAAGAKVWVPHFIALMARACAIQGNIEEALTLLDDALQIAERTGERWCVAELNRHKGQLMLRRGHAEAGEEFYRKALSIAGEQGAKLWELRAAVSLARLRRDQGRRSEAHDLLAPVYGWFTEGFGTPDLKDAKALLNELGGA
jgi:predicted ATPase